MLIIIRVELMRSQTLDTMKNSNLTATKQVLVNQPISSERGDPGEETAVYTKVSTL